MIEIIDGDYENVHKIHIDFSKRYAIQQFGENTLVRSF